MFDEEPHEERCPEGLLYQCCKREGHDGPCDDFSTARAVMAEKRVRELGAEVERLRAENAKAVQITDEWFDGDHPNPLHPLGMLIDPVRRLVTCGVGHWVMMRPPTTEGSDD